MNKLHLQVKFQSLISKLKMDRLDLIEVLEQERNDVVDFFDVYNEALARGLIEDIDDNEPEVIEIDGLDDFVIGPQADEREGA